MNTGSKNGKEINIIEMLLVLRSKLWLFIISAVLAAAAVICYCTFTYTPQYSATATIHLLRPQEDGINNVNTTDLAISNSIASDCIILLKSRDVISAVSKLYPEYNISKNRISASHPEGTHMLYITYIGNTAEETVEILNALIDEFKKKVVDIFKTDQVNTIESAEAPRAASNQKYPLSRFVLVLAVVLAEAALFIAIEFFDNKIKEQDDVERYLSLTVLGDIPPLEGGSGQAYGKYERYGRYTKYGKYGKYGRYGQYSKYGGYGPKDTKSEKTADAEKETKDKAGEAKEPAKTAIKEENK